MRVLDSESCPDGKAYVRSFGNRRACLTLGDSRVFVHSERMRAFSNSLHVCVRIVCEHVNYQYYIDNKLTATLSPSEDTT